MRMHSSIRLLFVSLPLAFPLAACGGAAEPARDPIVATPSSAPATTASAPASTSGGVVAPPITTPEQAARAFVDAIAKHDADAAVRVSDEDFGRGKTRAHADVTSAALDGAASADEWPGIEDFHATLFWATFTSGARSEKILLAV